MPWGSRNGGQRQRLGTLRDDGRRTEDGAVGGGADAGCAAGSGTDEDSAAGGSTDRGTEQKTNKMHTRVHGGRED